MVAALPLYAEMKRLPLDDPTVKPLAGKLHGLPKRFFHAQAKLYRKGPAGLESEITSLVSDIRASERTARISLGL